jgi:hypothetical protein
MHAKQQHLVNAHATIVVVPTAAATMILHAGTLNAATAILVATMTQHLAHANSNWPMQCNRTNQIKPGNGQTANGSMSTAVPCSSPANTTPDHSSKHLFATNPSIPPRAATCSHCMMQHSTVLLLEKQTQHCAALQLKYAKVTPDRLSPKRLLRHLRGQITTQD